MKLAVFIGFVVMFLVGKGFLPGVWLLAPMIITAGVFSTLHIKGVWWGVCLAMGAMIVLYATGLGNLLKF